MRFFRFASTALTLLLAFPVSPARADIFDQVDRIVVWFDRLNQSWTGVVDAQVRAQLLRSVDRFRRSLYLLESNSRLLLDSIGDAPPSPAEAAQLSTNVATLRQSLAEVNAARVALGADLRDAGGAEAEGRAVRAGAARGMALATLDDQLRDPRRWNAALVRNRLRAGIAALQKAQLALTQFRHRVAA